MGDTSQFNEDLLKNYNEENDEGYFLEVNFQYTENMYDLHIDLLFVPDRMKAEKIEKLVVDLQAQTEYAIHIRNLKEALNHGFVLKKLHRIIKFKLKAWVKIIY